MAPARVPLVTAALALVAGALAPSRASAQTLLFQGVVGFVAGAERGVTLSHAAVATGVRWASATQAAVTFRAGGAELRADVSLTDAEQSSVLVRSARGLALRTNSAFRVEAGAFVALPVRSGGDVLRVALPTELPFHSATVAGEVDTEPRDTWGTQGTLPVDLWAAPRVEGPVLTTRGERYYAQSDAAHPGWFRVLIERGGVLVRGYTWLVPREPHAVSVHVGTPATAGEPMRGWTRVSLPAGTRLAPRSRRGWSIAVHAPTEALQRTVTEGTEYLLTLDDGTRAGFFAVEERPSAP